MTENRAAQLIHDLELQPHPEGGYFREVYRSPTELGDRSAVTTIYFLLKAGDISRLHQVDADEIWHWYEGASLHLLSLTPELNRLDTLTLGPPAAGRAPVQVIPAHHWQAAESSGAYTLVGCTVAPGFEFSGFRFMQETEKQATIRSAFPEAARFL